MNKIEIEEIKQGSTHIKGIYIKSNEKPSLIINQLLKSKASSKSNQFKERIKTLFELILKHFSKTTLIFLLEKINSS